MYLDEQDLTDFLGKAPGIEYLDAIVIDLCGNAVGKCLPISHAKKILSGGTPVC